MSCILQGLCKSCHVAELQLSISNAVIVTPPPLEILCCLWRYLVQWLREGLWNSKFRNNVQHQALQYLQSFQLFGAVIINNNEIT